jgi:hypothetical protein
MWYRGEGLKDKRVGIKGYGLTDHNKDVNTWLEAHISGFVYI